MATRTADPDMETESQERKAQVGYRQQPCEKQKKRQTPLSFKQCCSSVVRNDSIRHNASNAIIQRPDVAARAVPTVQSTGPDI
jgi:hypothetical protein